MTDISHIKQFLRCETPDLWVQNALADIDMLIVDHANCEKKAASTAMNLIYRYVDNYELMNKMSKLAREELRHFEQVIAIMKKRNIGYPQIEAARYAGAIRKFASKEEPWKLIDTLIIGAIIEARSCERFAKIAPHLDEELSAFYLSLLKSESRHYEDYLSLARKAYAQSLDANIATIKKQTIDARIGELLEVEKKLIESLDDEFRFHSGPVMMD
jgi:tRNA-(ms[2]io[6]A)-hydroxylase